MVGSVEESQAFDQQLVVGGFGAADREAQLLKQHRG